MGSLAPYCSLYLIWYSTFCCIYYEGLVFILDQDERTVSVEQFISGKKDVLVATDVASKGLDFPNIQHVINYDMPDDIENYGRCLPL